MQRVVPTGCLSIDKLLGGGFPSDGVSLVYGEAETGKTSLAIQCAINCARMGYKSFFIDSDDSFSSRRLSQIAHQDNEKVSPFIYLMKPTTFQEQSRVIDHLEEYTTRKFGLVVIDTIASLYCVKLDGSKLTFALNRELNRQVALLTQFAKTRRVAALIISQVRNVF
ncbi:MAG: AAA family ATPase, partial [Candidatus Bathyarchaeota archaeon]|nr:AAA family ATPase [Candidatus Bathyarchaeota archaeon]